MSEDASPSIRRCTLKTESGEPCLHAGIWLPVLLLYPSVLHGPSKPMTIQVDAALCTGHKNSATVKDFATDHIYELAEKACANAGASWPERTLTRLKFLPYADSPLGRMKDRERAQAN
jgi:hypothetical protein